MCTATLNTRIRNRGLSAREILFQRDDHTGVQLNFSDDALSQQQLENRQDNHRSSALSQAPKGRHAIRADVNVGDLVYIKSDGDKHSAREKYIVVQTDWDHMLAKELKGSQFRSKLYNLRYDEVYPVPSPNHTSGTCHQDETYGRSEKFQTPASEETRQSSRPVVAIVQQPHLDSQPESQDTNTEDTAFQGDSTGAILSPTATEGATVLTLRPKRVAKKPEYLKDYVTDY